MIIIVINAVICIGLCCGRYWFNYHFIFILFFYFNCCTRHLHDLRQCVVKRNKPIDRIHCYYQRAEDWGQEVSARQTRARAATYFSQHRAHDDSTRVRGRRERESQRHRVRPRTTHATGLLLCRGPQGTRTNTARTDI